MHQRLVAQRSSRFLGWAGSTIGTPGEKPRNDPPGQVRLSVHVNTRIGPRTLSADVPDELLRRLRCGRWSRLDICRCGLATFTPT